MTLNVEVPDPPSLRGPQSREDYDAVVEPDDDPGDDYRRGELETILRNGAWTDAFREWADGTGLAEREFRTVVRLELIDRFDFYWDPSEDEVGYRAPEFSDEERGEFERDEDLVEDELDTLGRVVSEMLENEYLPRDDERWGFFADEEREDEYEFRDEE
ncbi:hypothetical protein HUG10_17200 [Halorarum halophilum]|uniref:DUF7992 domain-containing protein n=1 Tax=Halorarum halophilum TaxID=2743090 RepID=A0A7D5KVM3_9EURY|nr:hypothetical protein [Halobaculum halophilum]QLG29160.1 hypothetical protein HUG10_17200 [Halobaculum halophilum]